MGVVLTRLCKADGVIAYLKHNRDMVWEIRCKITSGSLTLFDLDGLGSSEMHPWSSGSLPFGLEGVRPPSHFLLSILHRAHDMRAALPFHL